MTRVIEPEWLDALPAEDPRAARSRRDLRRVNALMGNGLKCLRAIEALLGGRTPGRIVALGCGDAAFLAGIAGRKFRAWQNVEVVLVDRLAPEREAMIRAMETGGWTPRIVTADVFEWIGNAPDADVWLMNLFAHHFTGAQIAELFRGIAARASIFVACEPRRSAAALWASRALGLVGCNAVTRHDAVVSVRAGFNGREMSRLWPEDGTWTLTEGRAGAFSHLFTARRAVLAS